MDFNEFAVKFPELSLYNATPLGSQIVVPFNPNNGFVDPPVVAIEELEIVVPVIVPTEVKLLECKFPALSEYNEVLGSAIE